MKPSKVDREHAQHAGNACASKRGRRPCHFASPWTHMRIRLQNLRRYGRGALFDGEVPQIVCDHSWLGDVTRAEIDAVMARLERAV
jgi:hypothetical protein